jgi:CDP-diacylglycerol--glycerol-3-phosphate 3-phosphatidyltransferase
MARHAAKAHISPDALTASSLFMSLAAAGCAAYGQFSLAAALVILGGCLDLLDGAVARLTNQASRWGALLDSSVDRIADALPLTGLVLFYANNRVAMAFALMSIVFSFTISYVRARAESLGEALPQTFMRRAERMLLLVVALLLGTLSVPSVDAWLGAPRTPMLIWILLTTVLNFFGCCSIFFAARRALSVQSTEPIASHSTAGVRVEFKSKRNADIAPVAVFETCTTSR